MTQAEFTFLWLHTPAVTLYTNEERDARQEAVRQDARNRGYPEKFIDRDYPRCVPRSPEERAAILAKLARRASRPGYLRTDPWAGIDRNPWRITEAERKRLGLGRW